MQNSLSEMGTLYYLYSFSINLKLFKNKAFINNNGNKALTKLRELRILFFIKWGFLTHLFKWFGSILELPIAKSVLMTTALKGGLLQSAGPPGDRGHMSTWRGWCDPHSWNDKSTALICARPSATHASPSLFTTFPGLKHWFIPIF